MARSGRIHYRGFLADLVVRQHPQVRRDLAPQRHRRLRCCPWSLAPQEVRGVRGLLARPRPPLLLWALAVLRDLLVRDPPWVLPVLRGRRLRPLRPLRYCPSCLEFPALQAGRRVPLVLQVLRCRLLRRDLYLLCRPLDLPHPSARDSPVVQQDPAHRCLLWVRWDPPAQRRLWLPWLRPVQADPRLLPRRSRPSDLAVPPNRQVQPALALRWAPADQQAQPDRRVQSVQRVLEALPVQPLRYLP
jgi:hypothetical protein